MKYCKKCGESLQDQDKFCPNCGTAQTGGQGNGNGSVNLIKIIVIAVAAVAVIGLLLAVVPKLFRGRDPEPAVLSTQAPAATELKQTQPAYVQTEPPADEDTTAPETAAQIATEEPTEAPTEEPTEAPTEEDTRWEQEDPSDPLLYFIENCDRQYFEEEDIENFDEWSLILARNACYAKSGRRFADYRLREYFMQFDWYEPGIDASAFSDSLLNDYQLANIGLILAFEGGYGPMMDLEVGDTFTFGTYEQDNNFNNGQEPIKWIVLEKQGDYILVISKYGLDSRRYHYEAADVTWEDSSIRSWLNGTFYNTAFTDAEKRSIVLSYADADWNPVYDTYAGNATMDDIFLLSIWEAEVYFSDVEARFCKPTAYAIANGAYADPVSGGGWWLMRTPGHIGSYVASTNTDGTIDYDGGRVQSDRGLIRPAMWLVID